MLDCKCQFQLWKDRHEKRYRVSDAACGNFQELHFFVVNITTFLPLIEPLGVAIYWQICGNFIQENCHTCN